MNGEWTPRHLFIQCMPTPLRVQSTFRVQLLSSSTFLEASSQTSSGVCIYGDSKSNKVQGYVSMVILEVIKVILG